MKEQIERLSLQGTYKNSREVSCGGIPYSARDILMTAPLIAGLNVYLVGGTGEGKTQLANDLVGVFGEEASCYAEGRPDFEPAELLKQINLGRVREAASDRELVELTENVRKCLYYVDELNRCPPIVMNYFFNFFDGKLVHNGKVLKLGSREYAVGYASGNIGDGAYVGISDTDRALKDRMHLIVKLDDPHFSTTEEDDGGIFEGKKDPRATPPQPGKSALEDIISIHKAYGERVIPAVLPALGIYFHKGLDYLEDTARHSKRAVDQMWPNIKDARKDTEETLIFPLSKRAIFATMGLSQALEMIAEARGYEVKDSAAVFLDALRFTVPYSGVISPQYVHNENNGDVYAAFDQVMTKLRADIGGKRTALERALAFAQFGERNDAALDELCPPGREGKWAPVRRYIEGRAQKPVDESTAKTLGAIKEKYKKTE